MTALKEDQMWTMWQDAAPRIYDKTYYSGNPLVSKVNTAGHWLLEKRFGADEHFARVLEVGAGTGFHLSHVKHRFDEYVMTDISKELLDQAKERHAGRNDTAYDLQDATKLTYEDNSFDRLISVYNLEHLPQAYRVLREWQRVLKPGGLLSVSIPLDGGVAWRLGRYLTTRRSFAKEGLNLDYIIAREHVNPSYNLISLIHHYFANVDEVYYPTRIPMIDLNLVYSVNVRMSK